jgi:hypothetical protein
MRESTHHVCHISRLDTRRELFKEELQISADAKSAAYSAMMALNSLPEFHPHLEGNAVFYGHLLEILQGRFTEYAVQRLT